MWRWNVSHSLNITFTHIARRNQLDESSITRRKGNEIRIETKLKTLLASFSISLRRLETNCWWETITRWRKFFNGESSSAIAATRFLLYTEDQFGEKTCTISNRIHKLHHQKPSGLQRCIMKCSSTCTVRLFIGDETQMGTFPFYQRLIVSDVLGWRVHFHREEDRFGSTAPCSSFSFDHWKAIFVLSTQFVRTTVRWSQNDHRNDMLTFVSPDETHENELSVQLLS